MDEQDHDLLDTFTVPYDDSSEMDVVMRALGISRNTGTPGNVVAGDQQYIVGRHGSKTSQKRRTTLRKFQRKSDGKWINLSAAMSSAPKATDLVLYYVGTRSNQFTRRTGFTAEGSLYSPTKNGWVRQQSDKYAKSSQAVRNFLLSFMAPDLRTKYESRLGNISDLLHKANYMTHNQELAMFAPYSHFVLVFDAKAQKIVLFGVEISLCEATEYYDFEHYKMHNPESYLIVPNIMSEHEVELWMRTNIVRFARMS